MTPDFIFIFAGNRYRKLSLASLLCIRTLNGQTELVTLKGNLKINVGLHQLEKKLARYICRVHPSYLVALDSIISFDRHTVQLPGIDIPLDKRYSAHLKQRVSLLDRVSSLFIGKDGRLTHR